MNGSVGRLRLYLEPETTARESGAALPATAPDPTRLANRELIRPAIHRTGHHALEPFSMAWFEELERKRYTRHGTWLPPALEFGRHPGESILLLNPGIGNDAIRYLQCGTEVTIATSDSDFPDLIRLNLARHGFAAPVVSLSGSELPFPDGGFDVAVINALHESPTPAMRTDELFRVLKCGGKAIGLYPARFDAGYWQDLVLPYQHLYWRRPPDPTSTPKMTARDLRRAFDRFAEHKVFKRHLRRSELPHVCRVLPLVVLERLLGRVLVLKAMKPIGAARAYPSAIASERLAA